MTVRIVHSRDIEPGHGPHPAKSPYDKRVSDRLGLEHFEMYRVDLPADAQTTPHDHQEDNIEDAYAIVHGSGWLIVDGKHHPLEEGHFVRVSPTPRRYIRAGSGGCHLIAVCA